MSGRVVGVALAFTLIGSVVGVAAAAVVSDPGPFTGCLVGKLGLIYNVAKSSSTPLASCGKATQITFSNAQGPQGIQGIQGIQGVPGINGTNGAPGTNGTDGAPGVDGAPGPAGFASEAWIVRGPGGPFGAQLKNFIPETLGSIDLPAGTYTLFAKVNVYNADLDSQVATCELSTGEGSDNPLRIGSGEAVPFVLQDLLTLSAPGTVTFTCNSWDAQATNGKLTAISVSAIHG
jgi:hypothetical protein